MVWFGILNSDIGTGIDTDTDCDIALQICHDLPHTAAPTDMLRLGDLVGNRALILRLGDLVGDRALTISRALLCLHCLFRNGYPAQARAHIWHIPGHIPGAARVRFGGALRWCASGWGDRGGK